MRNAATRILFSILAACILACAGGCRPGGDGCVTVGTPSFSLSVDSRSGRMMCVKADDVDVFEDDGELPSLVAFDGVDIRSCTNAAWTCEWVCRSDDSTITVSFAAGEWRGNMVWSVFPEDRMVKRTLSFEWTGESPVKLHGVEVFNGKMSCRSSSGGYLFPRRFPPLGSLASEFSTGRVEEGPTYTPMAIGDNGAHSVMAGVNELAPYADFSVQRVIKRGDGFSMTTRFETSGWMRKGQMQEVVDIGLVFRDGTAEEHLRHTGEWFRRPTARTGCATRSSTLCIRAAAPSRGGRTGTALRWRHHTFPTSMRLG